MSKEKINVVVNNLKTILNSLSTSVVPAISSIKNDSPDLISIVLSIGDAPFQIYIRIAGSYSSAKNLLDQIVSDTSAIASSYQEYWYIDIATRTLRYYIRTNLYFEMQGYYKCYLEDINVKFADAPVLTKYFPFYSNALGDTQIHLRDIFAGLPQDDFSKIYCLPYVMRVDTKTYETTAFKKQMRVYGDNTDYTKIPRSTPGMIEEDTGDYIPCGYESVEGAWSANKWGCTLHYSYTINHLMFNIENCIRGEQLKHDYGGHPDYRIFYHFPIEIDDRNIYFPDAYIVDQSIISTENRYIGTPLVVIEVLRPKEFKVIWNKKNLENLIREPNIGKTFGTSLALTSAPSDMPEKFYTCAAAGVKEYWIADPSTQTLQVYISNGIQFELYKELSPGQCMSSTVLTDLCFPVSDIFTSKFTNIKLNKRDIDFLKSDMERLPPVGFDY